MPEATDTDHVALAASGGLVDPTVASTIDTTELVSIEQATDAVEGNSFVNDGETVLVVRNTDAADQTLTFDKQSPDNMGTLVNPVYGTVVITIPDSDSAVIGPFDPSVFGVQKASRSVQGGAGTVADESLVTFLSSSANILVYAVKIRAKTLIEVSLDV